MNATTPTTLKPLDAEAFLGRFKDRLRERGAYWAAIALDDQQEGYGTALRETIAEFCYPEGRFCLEVVGQADEQGVVLPPADPIGQIREAMPTSQHPSWLIRLQPHALEVVLYGRPDRRAECADWPALVAQLREWCKPPAPTKESLLERLDPDEAMRLDSGELCDLLNDTRRYLEEQK